MSGAVVRERRGLGRMGPEVSAIGLGCTSLLGLYGTSDDAAAIPFLQRAIDLGVDFLDSSDAYGLGQNEEVLGRALIGGLPGDPAATNGQAVKPRKTKASKAR